MGNHMKNRTMCGKWEVGRSLFCFRLNIGGELQSSETKSNGKMEDTTLQYAQTVRGGNRQSFGRPAAMRQLETSRCPTGGFTLFNGNAELLTSFERTAWGTQCFQNRVAQLWIHFGWCFVFINKETIPSYPYTARSVAKSPWWFETRQEARSPTSIRADDLQRSWASGFYGDNDNGT